jgi:FkbM family methyltransferase
VRVIHDWRWSLRLIGDALEELRIRPVGVIHVGAHLGQEVPLYLSVGLDRITLVEPDPEACATMAGQPWIENPGVGIVNKACGPRGRAQFHRMAEGAFSGLVRNREQSETASFTVEVVPVSDVQSEHPGNVLIVDTQGTEIEALRTADLSTLDLVIIETQTERRGAPGAYWPDLVEWCRESGWTARIQWKRDDRWSDMLLTPRRLTDPEPTP